VLSVYNDWSTEYELVNRNVRALVLSAFFSAAPVKRRSVSVDPADETNSSNKRAVKETLED